MSVLLSHAFSVYIFQLFSRNLITKPMDDEIVQEEENLLDLEGPEIQRDEVNQTATHSKYMVIITFIGTIVTQLHSLTLTLLVANLSQGCKDF